MMLSEFGAKTIWMFWAQGYSSAPSIVKACYESWTQANPEYDVVFLDMTNLPDAGAIDSIVEIYNEKNMSLQAFSDLLRVTLLAEFGGVWVDSTCLCTKPLREWIDAAVGEKDKFFAFRNTGGREIASWFLFSAPGSRLMSEYKSKVDLYWQSRKGPVQSAPHFLNRCCYYNKGIGSIFVNPLFFRLTGVYPYFWFHYIFYRLVSRDSSLKSLWLEVDDIKSKGSHLIQDIGYLTPFSECRHLIDFENIPPVQKLTWRMDVVRGDGSLLDALLSRFSV